MIRLSKKVEYGLIALRHLALLPDGESATAREIAETCSLPQELCAKSLSLLSRGGLVASIQGIRGGYSLARRPDAISVHDVILAIEEKDPAVTECLGGDGDCQCALNDNCVIREPLRQMQEDIARILSATTLAGIIEYRERPVTLMASQEK
jgi:Rrf2 family protein